jgi:hypothetical protein
MILSRLVVLLVCGGLFGGVWWLTESGTGVAPLQDDEIAEEAEETCLPRDRLPNGDCPPNSFRCYYLMGHYTGGPGVGK